MPRLRTLGRAALAGVRPARWLGHLLRGQVVGLVGGPARARVIVLLGCVLALNTAQISTVGAVAPQLERSLHVGNTKIGLLNAVALLVGAVAVIPVGLVVDRVRRIPMLAASIVLWSVTTLLGAVAPSYASLLLTRVGLGAVAATAGPAIASLTGDYFPSRERGRIYGYILSGELVGAAAGFLVSGTVASAFSWRAAFGLLALPGFFLARALWRTSLGQAVRYILRIPTNTLLIIGSALGYFFFAGLQTFAVVFVRGHYHASQATATLVLGLLVLGALAGTLASGPLTDALVRRSRLEARVWVPALCYLGAAALLVPGLLISHLSSAIWFYVGGAALISAANPPLDAARLDIMPSGLWGRAESARTFLRSLAQAVAPLLFGAVADLVAGFVPQQAPIGTHTHGIVSSATGTGLQVSFLVMLSALAAAGIFLLRARNTYPTDVATAGAAPAPAPPSPPAPIAEPP